MSFKKWCFTPQATELEATRSSKSAFAWFYNSKHWRVARDKAIKSNPVCRKCEENGLTTPSRTVNHITPMRVIVQSGATNMREITSEELAKATSQSNLEALCLSCHGIEEAEMLKMERAERKNKAELQRQADREQRHDDIIRKRSQPDNFSYQVAIDEYGNKIILDIF